MGVRLLGFGRWVSWLVGGHAGRIPRLLITQFGAADGFVYRKVHVGLSSSWHLLFFSRFLDAFALDHMDSAQDDFNQREK